MKPAAKDKLASALIHSVLVALVALGLAGRAAEGWECVYAALMQPLAGRVAGWAGRVRHGRDDGAAHGGGQPAAPPGPTGPPAARLIRLYSPQTFGRASPVPS